MPDSRNTPTVPPTEYNLLVMGVGPDVVADVEDLRDTDDVRPNQGDGIYWDEDLQLWIYLAGSPALAAHAALWNGHPPHGLGSAMHLDTLLAGLNALITDANLDDAGDARPPIAHGPTHIDPLLDPVPYATAAQRGLMSNIAQTFAGVKTFNDRVNSPSHSILTRHIQCEVFTAAGINACMAELGATGGEVYLPKNTYLITESIVIPQNNITLRGAGKGTILDASAGQTFHVINVNAKGNCVIRDLQIKGKAGGGQNFELIYDNAGVQLTVDKCLLIDSDRYGIYLEDADESVISHCIFDNNDSWGVYNVSAVRVKSALNLFRSCRGAYFDVNSFYGKFLNNHVYGGAFAVDIRATNCDVMNNTIHASSDGIELRGNYCVVANNSLLGAGASYAIHINGGAGNLVIGNNILAPTTQHNVRVENGVQNRILGNIFRGGTNTKDHLWVSGAAETTISGNSFIDPGAGARAINLVNSPDCTVADNYSEGHNTCGLEIDAASTGLSIGGNKLTDATPVIDNASGHLYEVYGRFVAGGIADNFEVEADGTIVFHGAARVWDDIQFPINTGKVPAVGFPTREALTPNTSAYAFSVNDYIDLTTNEYSHAYKEGGILHMHAHVTIKTAQATGANRFVKLQVWVAYADVAAVAWAEVTLSAELTIPTGSGALKLFYLDLGNVDMSGYVIEAQINVRVKRIAATGGTEYADDVYITQVGAHLEKDTVGSRSENTK